MSLETRFISMPWLISANKWVYLILCCTAALQRGQSGVQQLCRCVTFAALPRPIDHVLRIKTGTGTFIMWFKIPGPCSSVQVYVLYSTVRWWCCWSVQQQCNSSSLGSVCSWSLSWSHPQCRESQLKVALVGGKQTSSRQTERGKLPSGSCLLVSPERESVFEERKLLALWNLLILKLLIIKSW